MATTSLPPQEGISADQLDTEPFRATKPRVSRRGRPPGSGKARTDKPPLSDDIKAPVEEPGAVTPGKVEEAFAQILSLPALVYKAPTPWHCDWCASHFAKQGPLFAKDLVDNRAGYPALYAAMEKIAGAWMAVGLMPGLISYAGPPIIHHGPEALQPMGTLFGVPEREKKAKKEPEIRRHEHSSASDGTIPRDSYPPAA